MLKTNAELTPDVWEALTWRLATTGLIVMVVWVLASLTYGEVDNGGVVIVALASQGFWYLIQPLLRESR